MKKQALLFLSVASVIGCSAFLWLQQPALGSFRLEDKKENEGKEATYAKEAMERRMEKLKDENGEFHASYYYDALKLADQMKAAGNRSGFGLAWEELGPDNVGGRTRAILIDKRDNTHNTVYAGGVGGGMWKSTDGANTWTRLSNWNQWLTVSCIAQGPGPDYSIYVGTGEGLSQISGTSFNSGNIGNGIYKLVNDSPVLITPDAFSSNSINSADIWGAVNRIAVNPLDGNQLIAATQKGLYQTNDGGGTWNVISISGISNGTGASDVKWSKDGINIFASVGGNPANKLVQSPNGGFSWNRISNLNNPGFPGTQGRIEIAIAPSNSNIVYVSIATSSGQTYGVYRSQNASDPNSTWASIGNKGPLFDPFGDNAQGWYDNVIAVSPQDPNRVYLGGVDFYTWSDQAGWKLADAGLGSGNANPNYIHPDKHAITICEDDANLMYVGCDGGVYKSTNAYSAFPYPNYAVKNRGYNVTQNYSVAASPSGEVMGGAQDNGTNYINFIGNTRMAAEMVLGGDGTYSEISHINPRMYFGGIYFGANYRSANKGSSFDNFFDVKIDPQGHGQPSGCGGQKDANAPFISAFWLSETKNAENGTKTAKFKAVDRDYAAGETVTVKSNAGDYPYQVILPANVSKDSVLAVSDPVRSRFLMNSNCGIWLTPDALNLAAIPKWYRLMTTMSGIPYSVSTTSNGDIVYIGTSGGRVYRCPNFNSRVDNAVYPTGTGTGVIYTSTAQFTSSAPTSRPIEGISVDPDDSNHVVAVCSGFTAAGTAHVFESHNGGTSWTPLTTGLPNMPVYDVVVHDANTIIIGTELGIWSWDGTTWNEENNGMQRVPVYRLIEKPLYTDGCKVLYAGTHGRGMWRCATFAANGGCATTTSVTDVKTPQISNMSIFPNPVSSAARISLVLDNHQDVTLRVFDMAGKLYKEVTMHNTTDGENLFDLDASGLGNGTYVLAATVGNTRTQSKLFVVTK
jgi:photosystem II stability/assembly factor-like uncharacterized protein